MKRLLPITFLVAAFALAWAGAGAARTNSALAYRLTVASMLTAGLAALIAIYQIEEDEKQ